MIKRVISHYRNGGNLSTRHYHNGGNLSTRHYRDGGNLPNRQRKPEYYTSLLCFSEDTRLREHDRYVKRSALRIREYDGYLKR